MNKKVIKNLKVKKKCKDGKNILSDEGKIEPDSNLVSLTLLKLKSQYPEINKFIFFTITF